MQPRNTPGGSLSSSGIFPCNSSLRSSTLCVVSQQSWFGLFFHKFFNFSPPPLFFLKKPPYSPYPPQVNGKTYTPEKECPIERCRAAGAGKLQPQTRGTVFVKHQEIRLQEPVGREYRGEAVIKGIGVVYNERRVGMKLDILRNEESPHAVVLTSAHWTYTTPYDLPSGGWTDTHRVSGWNGYYLGSMLGLMPSYPNKTR